MPAKLSARQYAIALYETVKGRSGEELEAKIRRFVQLLASHRRLSLASSVIAEYERHVLEQQGKAQAEAVTARPLNHGASATLVAALSKRFDREIVLTARTDPAVIGGVRVRLNDVLIDGTVAAQLADLKKQLLTE
ncbi:MAG: ATP synthase F1 subunit delta [Candidatus Hydrogenedentes bacterium]|nr:ATP synthase F1 subunit delta [Candidatus Hydrogenedentota bacterium]